MLRMATVVVAALAILATMVSVASGVGGGVFVETPKPEKQAAPIYVLAPIGGIFWRGEYQGAKPYVEVGVDVEPTTMVAQVEHFKALKLTAGVHGTIVEILVADGQLVAAWQPLMKIIPKPVKTVPK